MKCNHKWEVGNIVIIEHQAKIKTKCILCHDDIIVEFGHDYHFSENGKSIYEIEKETRKNNGLG